MIDRDQPSVAELLQEGSLLALVDEGFTGGIDIVDAAARIVAMACSKRWRKAPGLRTAGTGRSE
jgi:hypothetical protein